MHPFAILVSGLIAFWILESLFHAQPLPKNRYQHGKTNLAISVVNLMVLASVGAGLTFFTIYNTEQAWGLKPLLKDLNPAGPAFLTVALLLMFDFGNYWIHRSQHIFANLWPLHRSHHSDPYLDATSAFRFHPFESVYRAACQCLLILGLGMNVADLVLYQGIVISALLFSHANIQLPRELDRWIGYIFATPDIHRVHHSEKREEHDSNFGIVFMFWDRIHGTFTPPAKVSGLTIGLQEYADRSQTMLSILKDPFQKNLYR